MLKRFRLALLLVLLGFTSAHGETKFLLLNFQIPHSGKSLDSLSGLYNEIKKKPVDSTTLELLKQLSIRYRTLNPAKALQYAEEGIKICRKNNHSHYLANFHANKGQIYRQEQQLDLALESFLTAISIYQKFNDYPALIYSWIDVGNVYYDQERYSEATLNYHKALGLAKSQNHPRGKAVAFSNLGQVYDARLMIDSAIYYQKLALQAREESHDLGGKGYTLQQLAKVYLRAGMFDAAEVELNKSVKLLDSLQITDELARAMVLRGRLNYERGKLKAGDSAFYAAVKLFDEMANPAFVNDALVAKAEALIKRGKSKEGIALLKDALQQLSNDEQYTRKRHIHELLYNTYRENGDALNALIHLELVYHDDVNRRNKDVNRKLSELHLQLLLSSKEEELKNSKASLEEKEAAIASIKNRNRSLLVLVGGIAVIMLLVVFLSWYRGRMNKRLRHQNEIIQEQKNEIEENLKKIEQSRIEAQLLVKAKSDFLSQMSHEIRTPMNSIMGITDLLLEDTNDVHQLDKLNSVRYAADLLLVILNDILHIASIEEGNIELSPVETDIFRLFRELENNLSRKAIQKELQLVFEPGDGTPSHVITDPTRLFQILMNLISNAIKFTDAGKVTVRTKVVRRDEKNVRLRFEVEDTGIGIAKEKQDVIFESFQQGGVEIHRKYGGTGLGLTITHRILQLFDSRIEIDSIPGKGSIFAFELEFDLVEPKSSSKSVVTDLHELTDLRLLYVEDNEMNQKVMKMLLNKFDIQLDFAFHGKEAIDKLTEKAYDLVLMDFHMPIMDGLECTRQIRSGKSGVLQPLIPIIGVTADVFEESTREGLKCGMNSLVKKPIDKNELFGAITRLHLLNQSDSARA